MRVLVIVLIVLGVVLAAVVVFGVAKPSAGTRQPTQMSDGAPPLDDGGDVDKDTLEDWDPPSIGTVMARAFAPFAPKLKLPKPRIEAGANPLAPELRFAPRDKGAGKNDMRIARIEWQSGAPMLVKHNCARDDGCPETLCLCAVGAYDEDLFDPCEDSWAKRREGNDGKLRCRAGDESGSLVVYREGGAISFLGLGGSSSALVK